MKISDKGIKLLEQREGDKLVAYRDTRGIPTIGVGHTGKDVHIGEKITQAQSDALLRADLGWVETTVNSSVKKPMTQDQYDAFVSICFNIGAAGFANSTFVKRFNAGDPPLEVASAIMFWVLPSELLGRRKNERLQFLGKL